MAPLPKVEKRLAVELERGGTDCRATILAAPLGRWKIFCLMDFSCPTEWFRPSESAPFRSFYQHFGTFRTVSPNGRRGLPDT